MPTAKNTVCLWYNGDAEDAATFYARTFPDSKVEAVHHAPGYFPSGSAGSVLTVQFTVAGFPSHLFLVSKLPRTLKKNLTGI